MRFSILLCSILLCNCNTPSRSNQLKADSIITKVKQFDTSTNKNYHSDSLLRISKDLIAVLGHRFTITGDFDGDGKQEQLVEHFYSRITNQETNKSYLNLDDYDLLVKLTIDKNPFVFLQSTNDKIAKFKIDASPQIFGISYLKNEGDLNSDGIDDVSYVVDWADWSSLNTCHIISYRNQHWEELYAFDIWDWQVPNTEENSTTGINTSSFYDKYSDGLVKKIGTNKIQLIYRNEESLEDTMVVDLSK